jgi:hypothetical protein
MSHTTTVSSIKLVSKTAIEGAIKDLKGLGINVDLLENAKPRAFYSNQQGMGQADMVIQLHDSKYDIGLYRQEDNSYEARADFFAGEIAKVLGTPRSSNDVPDEQANMGKFFQAYSRRAVMDQALSQGYAVTETMNSDGSLVLTLAS